MLNIYSVIARFVNKPLRNPQEDFNVTRLFLAWVEFGEFTSPRYQRN